MFTRDQKLEADLNTKTFINILKSTFFINLKIFIFFYDIHINENNAITNDSTGIKITKYINGDSLIKNIILIADINKFAK